MYYMLILMFKGQSVLISGAGPIGIAMLVCLQACKAGTIFVSEPAEFRAETARKFGADHVFNPKQTNVVEEIMKATGGRGVDVSFECSGVQAGVC